MLFHIDCLILQSKKQTKNRPTGGTANRFHIQKYKQKFHAFNPKCTNIYFTNPLIEPLSPVSLISAAKMIVAAPPQRKCVLLQPASCLLQKTHYFFVPETNVKAGDGCDRIPDA